jgi:5-methylcytosine-specific restriction protein A
MKIAAFTPGKIYKRSTIHDSFGGNRQSGISPSKKSNSVFIFTGESGEQFGYTDSWDIAREVFTYTGEGQTGDMSMNSGNAAIKDHVQAGRALHLFQIIPPPELKTEETNAQGKGYCRYICEMQCAGVIEELGPDKLGSSRRIYQFQLVRVDALDFTEYTAGPEQREKQPATDISLIDLREKALHAAKPQQGKARDTRRSIYERARHVTEYALARSEGKCESCKTPAPFRRVNGSPYLEVHHIDRLSDGGLDAPHRVAAICPTCHRHIHFGEGGNIINDALRVKIDSIEQSLAKQPS